MPILRRLEGWVGSVSAAGRRWAGMGMRGYGFLRVGGREQQAFLEVPEPVPGPGELLVRVRAAGVNPGDWRMREGFYGTDGPAVLGREVAGTVLAAGDGVTGFAPGDEVFGGCPGMVGGWAPKALVMSSFAAHRQDGASPERAAVLPVAAGTAYDTLENLRLEPGSTLLINGAGGGVGVALVQLARLRGLAVVGTASPAKHDLLTRLGATPVAYGDGVADRIRAAAPNGIDGVLDLVGGAGVARPRRSGTGRVAVLGRRQGPGHAARRGRGGARPEHRGAVRARPPGRCRPARPARHRGPSAGRGGRGAGAGRERARHREGRADSLNPGS